MADLTQLLAGFESGELCRPDASQPNFVDVVRAIGLITGALDGPNSANSRQIGDQIGEPEHLVFVLVDGLGTHCLEHLGPESWLRTHLAAEIQSVFPPTTSAAITSIAKADWPAKHGAVGWWTYLAQLREAACILPFVRHRDGEDLRDCGVTPEAVLGSRTILGEMARSTAIAQPTAIIDSTYSGWFGSGADTLPYDDHAEAADKIAAHIRDADEPTFTYWYAAAVDHASHEHGSDSAQARAAVTEVDKNLARLAEHLERQDARIVVTADHGHRDAGARFPVDRDDPLCDFLRCPPSGDMRLGFYHLQDGARQAFTHEFEHRYGEYFALISTQELDDLRLLGPEPLAAETRRRVGDLASIALDDSVMRYTGGSDGDRFMHQRSHHSGLSFREMTIPLVIG